MTGYYKEIHVHVKRIPIEEVPASDAECSQWLYKRFEEKDRFVDSSVFLVLFLSLLTFTYLLLSFSLSPSVPPSLFLVHKNAARVL